MHPLRSSVDGRYRVPGCEAWYVATATDIVVLMGTATPPSCFNIYVEKNHEPC